ncbi:unnamed protein product [Parascedosporium putredinis]|uniref:67 kDa myosin-cross-reactive antigen family protein n=1 Tax=Parascedosporium putredinis TaxID=1442378 RepID=A0A9P1HAA3_9PEZI|nr:unnamed protein product [Parascedosporium putredinis]CAI8001900.1 unnamed protein product [Parascedosporium putredinis]
MPIDSSAPSATTTNGGIIPRYQRDPLTTDAWLVGGGIASLAAAVHLINDAKVPASRIHILEASPTPGGSMAAEDEPSATPAHPIKRKGYVIRAARKLNFSYRCFYDTLSKVPCPSVSQAQENGSSARTNAIGELNGSTAPTSNGDAGNNRGTEDFVIGEEAVTESPPRTLLDSIRRNHSNPKNRGRTKVRLVSLDDGGRPETVDTATMGLSPRDQAALMAFILRSEESLGFGTIRDFFELDFFETNFWDMMSTMYLFKPWHSAIELRRYLHRFLHEFPNISTLSGMEYMPSNDFEATIVPLVAYLKEAGVDFQDLIVTGIAVRQQTEDIVIPVKPTDIVLVTLGSMTSGSAPGTNTTPPAAMPKNHWVHDHPDPIWKFWLGLSESSSNPHRAKFGDPRLFREHQGESMGVAFTITMFDQSFTQHLLAWAGSTHGTCPLLSFRDCPWLLSITIPQQPYFKDQPADTTVFWGYGLYPDQPGRFPPAGADAGEFHHAPGAHALITSPYIRRDKDSRPQVVPRGSQNLGLMGQYVEMARDVTFTMEYSVRSAQIAVYELMGLDKKPPEVFGEDPSAAVLGEALKTLMM